MDVCRITPCGCPIAGTDRSENRTMTMESNFDRLARRERQFPTFAQRVG